MPRGRITALTITLTPEERQTLERWQRATASLVPPSGVPGASWGSPQDTVGLTPHICKGNRDEDCLSGVWSKVRRPFPGR